MSKIALSLGSFVAGLLFSFFLFPGSRSFAQSQITLNNGAQIIGPGAPAVPPISRNVGNLTFSGASGAVQVDGLSCVKCVFNGPTLEYGGGNFAFADSAFSGPIRFQFTGAARNTIIFLEFLQQLNEGKPPLQHQQPRPGGQIGPIVKTALVKDEVRASINTTGE